MPNRGFRPRKPNFRSLAIHTVEFTYKKSASGGCCHRPANLWLLRARQPGSVIGSHKDTPSEPFTGTMSSGSVVSFLQSLRPSPLVVSIFSAPFFVVQSPERLLPSWSTQCFSCMLSEGLLPPQGSPQFSVSFPGIQLQRSDKLSCYRRIQYTPRRKPSASL